jgi:RES domain-containing protein
MLLYRVAMGRYAADLSGDGARRAGGRWNPKGVAVLYTSDHPAIAFLEVYAGMSAVDIPPTVKLVTFELPDTLAIQTILVDDLPDNWNARPPRSATMHYGEKWQREGMTPILKVPSTLVPPGCGFNYILNPAHPDLQGAIKLTLVDWNIDPRLMR